MQHGEGLALGGLLGVVVALLVAAAAGLLHLEVVAHALGGEVGAGRDLARAEVGLCARVQHGIAEVDVVDQHHRLLLVALVGHHVVDVHDVALRLQRVAALHQHVGAKDLRLVHLAAHADHALVALVFDGRAHLLGGDVAHRAVQAQGLAVVHTGSAAVGDSAGGHHAAAELLQEARSAVLLEQVGRADAHLVGQADVDALVGQVGDVQAAIRQQGHFQIAAVLQIEGAQAPGRAIVVDVILEAAERIDVVAFLAKFVFLGFLHIYILHKRHCARKYTTYIIEKAPRAVN